MARRSGGKIEHIMGIKQRQTRNGVSGKYVYKHQWRHHGIMAAFRNHGARRRRISWRIIKRNQQ